MSLVVSFVQPAMESSVFAVIPYMVILVAPGIVTTLALLFFLLNLLKFRAVDGHPGTPTMWANVFSLQMGACMLAHPVLLTKNYLTKGGDSDPSLSPSLLVPWSGGSCLAQ